ncbi:MAG: hypothetical protein HYZ75_01280 [Elusimicrobia bacterium]|nr:hypothetical protein [Elusimicrobiota bacterium]
MAVLDLDGDGALSRDELMAGNFSNIAVDAASVREYRLQEAQCPKPAELVRDLKIPIALFHGEWDNQAPVYGTKSIELLNKAIWKKPTISFRYFPKLGHALDPRATPRDLTYRRAAPEAFRAVADTIASL